MGKQSKIKTSLQNTLHLSNQMKKLKWMLKEMEKISDLTIVLGDRSTLVEVQSDNFTFLGGLKLSAN